MEERIRNLRADEIDVRVGQYTKDKTKFTLLLYQDGRCAMNILDETFGSLYWKKTYSRDNRNCTISVYNKEIGQWIEKEDTGVESNNAEEKGLASDSFKRASVNFGVGRELYTCPQIWITVKDANDKHKYQVAKITYKKDDKGNELKEINNIAIKDTRTGEIVFTTRNPE